jgi:hypothetical protein
MHFLDIQVHSSVKSSWTGNTYHATYINWTEFSMNGNGILPQHINDDITILYWNSVK